MDCKKVKNLNINTLQESFISGLRLFNCDLKLNMVSRKLYKLFWVVYIITIATAQSQNHPTNLNKQGFMADGFDVVSYFSGTPEKGKSAYVAEYQSAKFMFRSEDNKKKVLRKS